MYLAAKFDGPRERFRQEIRLLFFELKPNVDNNPNTMTFLEVSRRIIKKQGTKLKDRGWGDRFIINLESYLQVHET